MKKKYFILVLLLLPFSLMANTLYSRASGAWSAPGTWSTVTCGGASCGCTPGSGDIVIICAGHIVTGGALAIGGAGNINSLTIQTGASLDMSGNSLIVNSGGTLDISGTMITQNVNILSGGNVKVHAGSTFTIQGNFANASNSVTLNGTVTVAGNFANSGNMTINGSVSVAKNFTNNGSSVISGEGCLSVAGSYANISGTVFGTNGGSSAPCPNTPLPITLTSFTATYLEQSNSVVVNWVVAIQLNNKEFVIEKTTDGVNYTDIETVPGAGTTPFSKSYSITDYNPANGISYYRLKQIDVDGNTTLYAPVAVSIGISDQSNTLHIYPNPVGAMTTLVYNCTNQNPLAVDITDITGRIISSFTLDNVQIGENSFPVNTSMLKPGVYFLRATEAQKVYTLKIVR